MPAGESRSTGASTARRLDGSMTRPIMKGNQFDRTL
jgi:hypothetical protein